MRQLPRDNLGQAEVALAAVVRLPSSQRALRRDSAPSLRGRHTLRFLLGPLRLVESAAKDAWAAVAAQTSPRAPRWC